MRTTRKIAVLFFACLLAACSSTPSVSVDYNPEYDFSDIKSYYQPPREEAGINTIDVGDLADQRFRRAAEAEMNLRGVELAPSRQADIWITYHVVTQDKTRITSYDNHYGYARPYGYSGGTSVDVRQYTEGTLIVDLVDPATKKTVWRGVVSAIVKDRTTEEREALTRTYVAAIVNEIPGFSLPEE
ncbi:DUF4136 domain-containing protein [Oceanicoccus sagamiensis]|uniref:DUF4136 domain-containing protein n=1 Tax=Oceanicoccus sagamiensis TaxID=716816 RepID=A0A1X9NJX5_9GAMM|nr:DUF4136 domain-containing protein [Oceanicoccus sagamiensis]ARN74273.1 hypothetical protein BST96_09150 [Oceanicoccus sagamiensis]